MVNEERATVIELAASAPRCPFRVVCFYLKHLSCVSSETYYLHSNNSSFISVCDCHHFFSNMSLFLHYHTVLLLVFGLYLLPHGISTETGTFGGSFLDIANALCFLNPPGYPVTPYYCDGYFIECSLTEHTPTTWFEKWNIVSTLFLLKHVPYWEWCPCSLYFGEITLCFIWYLNNKVRTSECAQNVSRTEILREKDCCYTSGKKRIPKKKVI